MSRWLLVPLVFMSVSACSSTVSGSGQLGQGVTSPPSQSVAPSSSAPSVPSVPPPPSSSSSRPPANPLACPHISYAAGRLAFDCVTSRLVPTPGDLVWRLTLSRPVEPGWSIAEGAQVLRPRGGHTLQQVALGSRAAMLAHGQYGDSPTVTTVSARAATVAGVPAYIVQSTITLNPEYRAQSGLAVRIEKLWIVSLNAGDGNVATWYVTIPDDLRELWPKVPAIIASIGLI